jgi:hypothetical protein
LPAHRGADTLPLPLLPLLLPPLLPLLLAPSSARLAAEASAAA